MAYRICFSVSFIFILFADRYRLKQSFASLLKVWRNDFGTIENILALGNYPQVSRIYVDYDSNYRNHTITEPGTLLDVRYVFRDYPDMSWVYLEPIQCDGNPYSGHVISETFEQLRAYEQISAYYLREHGITVHDAVHMRGLFEITLACSSEDGSRLYLLVDDQSLDTMMSLGFKTISTGLNIYGK